MAHQKQSGFTLMELMIVIAIIAILTVIAFPYFADIIERNKLKQAAEGLKSELEWTRSEAIKQSCNASMVFTTGMNWQYIITPCTGAAKTTTATSPKVSMSSTSFTGDTVTFDFRRGGAENAGVTFATSNYQVRVEVKGGQRIQICNPVVADAVGGYESC